MPRTPALTKQPSIRPKDAIVSAIARSTAALSETSQTVASTFVP